jgi:hypothetical protein
MTKEVRNSYVWQVGLTVYIPDEDDVNAVKENGFTPTDTILIEQGFWTEEECLAFRIFSQSAISAIDNPSAFIESYREVKARREEENKPKSNLIIPERRIITN